MEYRATYPTGVGPEDWKRTDAIRFLGMSIAGDAGADLYIDGRGGRSVGGQSGRIGTYYGCRVCWKRHGTNVSRCSRRSAAAATTSRSCALSRGVAASSIGTGPGVADKSREARCALRVGATRTSRIAGCRAATYRENCTGGATDGRTTSFG